MNMLHHIFVGISMFVLIHGIKFRGRKESIQGETYFGSEQLLATDIDDVKPFIAECTLPETGLEVSGSAVEIHEQFERHNKENVTYSELVLKWIIHITNPGVEKNYYLDLDRFGGMYKVKELWIIVNDNDNQDSFFGTLLINISTTNCVSLQKLHLIGQSRRGYYSNVRVLLPKDFWDIRKQLTAIHISSVIYTIITYDDTQKFIDCFMSRNYQSACYQLARSRAEDSLYNKQLKIVALHKTTQAQSGQLYNLPVR